MRRVAVVFAAFGLATGLTGCNGTSGGLVASAPPPPADASPSALSLPAGTACASEIDRFQTVVKADLATGNVQQNVYNQIQRDLTRAASACSAGRGSEALRIVASSKTRHGYRAG